MSKYKTDAQKSIDVLYNKPVRTEIKGKEKYYKQIIQNEII